jgi:hypothetical protein
MGPTVRPHAQLAGVDFINSTEHVRAVATVAALYEANSEIGKALETAQRVLKMICGSADYSRCLAFPTSKTPGALVGTWWPTPGTVGWRCLRQIVKLELAKAMRRGGEGSGNVSGGGGGIQAVEPTNWLGLLGSAVQVKEGDGNQGEMMHSSEEQNAKAPFRKDWLAVLSEGLTGIVNTTHRLDLRNAHALVRGVFASEGSVNERHVEALLAYALAAGERTQPGAGDEDEDDARAAMVDSMLRMSGARECFLAGSLF